MKAEANAQVVASRLQPQSLPFKEGLLRGDVALDILGNDETLAIVFALVDDVAPLTEVFTDMLNS